MIPSWIRSRMASVSNSVAASASGVYSLATSAKATRSRNATDAASLTVARRIWRPGVGVRGCIALDSSRNEPGGHGTAPVRRRRNSPADSP